MKRRITTAVLVGMVGVVALAFGAMRAQEGAAPDVDERYIASADLPAPPFPDGLDWLNVPAPLTVEALRGKVILLDFWTYGCINCIHMIPTLRRLEEKFPNELVVIGVHSAKFANEGVTENIREIVQRYDVHHPVINDSDFRVWNTYRPYGVNAWPTFVVIDPRGNILAVQAGEIPFEAFDPVISGMISTFDTLGEIDRTPLELALEGADDLGSALNYPGKVLADTAGGRLFIADTNHHRIVVADLSTYAVQAVIGTGGRGYTDGAYDAAQFNQPQGMTLSADGATLYVADVENHAIRTVDLNAQTVATLVGDGTQYYDRDVLGRAADEVGLASPWDVTLGDGVLWIASAGTHQIFGLELATMTYTYQIGSGREGIADGGFPMAQLAQPSGLFYRDGVLYFADSESSAIRSAHIATQTTDTLAGPVRNDLFDFGDADGGFGTSRLQHPLGVTGTPDGLIFAADTYNSRIRQITPDKQTTTVFGQSAHGFADGSADTAAFYEPGGIDYADGRLYVADTNNHAVRVIDLATATVSTVQFPNPEALQLGDAVIVAGGNAAAGERLTLDAQTVAAGAGEIILTITLPDGFKLNPLAPSAGVWRSSGDAAVVSADAQTIDASEVRVPVTLSAGEATLTGDLTIYYCREGDESLCYLDSVMVEAPITVSVDAATMTVAVERAIIPPAIVGGGIGG